MIFTEVSYSISL